MKIKCLILLPFFVVYSQGATVDVLTLTLNDADRVYSVTDCLTSASGSLEIPSAYGGLPVTSIGSEAFSNCTSLTSIIIPNTVTSIGFGAFADCTSLASIAIPESITSIENFVFLNCTSLTSITIPEGVTWLGWYAFSNCTNLSTITIPESVTSIGSFVFADCSSLSSIRFDGPAPSTSITSAGIFSNVLATNIIVEGENIASYGGYGSTYEGLQVASLSHSDYDALISERDAALTTLVTTEAERDARPTQAIYDVVVAERDTAIAERDARLTMDQVRDARVGSTMIVVSEGKADITMTLEETSDLSDWSSATTSEKTIEVDAPSGIRFYRFKMTE